MTFSAGTRSGNKTVAATHVHQDREFTDLRVIDSAGRTYTLKATQNHPFWNGTTQAWVEAADLKVGDKLYTSDRGDIRVQAVTNYTGRRTMHDLTVADVHTYYVLAGDEPVLVHNVNTPIACGVNGEPIYDVPVGSAGGQGAGDRIPASMLEDYNIGVNADPTKKTPLCSYCRTRPANAVDHVHPRSKKGDLTDANTTPACTPCNSSKNNKPLPVWDAITLDDAGMKLDGAGNLVDDW